MEEQRKARGRAIDFGDHDFGMRARTEQGRAHRFAVVDDHVAQMLVIGQLPHETADEIQIRLDGATQSKHGFILSQTAPGTRPGHRGEG